MGKLGAPPITAFKVLIVLATLTQLVNGQNSWNEDYTEIKRNDHSGRNIFMVIFLLVGSIGACVGCYCRFCGGADRYYGQPVRYVGRGVYIPESIVAQRLSPGEYQPSQPYIVGQPGGPYYNNHSQGQPYRPTTQPFGYDQPPQQPYGFGQQYGQQSHPYGQGYGQQQQYGQHFQQGSGSGPTAPTDPTFGIKNPPETQPSEQPLPNYNQAQTQHGQGQGHDPSPNSQPPPPYPPKV